MNNISSVLSPEVMIRFRQDVVAGGCWGRLRWVKTVIIISFTPKHEPFVVTLNTVISFVVLSSRASESVLSPPAFVVRNLTPTNELDLRKLCPAAAKKLTWGYKRAIEVNCECSFYRGLSSYSSNAGDGRAVHNMRCENRQRCNAWTMNINCIQHA